MRLPLAPALAGLLALVAGPAAAVPYVWTDWTDSDAAGGFSAYGTLTTDTTTVDVVYNNPNGVSFFYDGEGAETDYWANTRTRNAATSPYTSLPNAALGSPGVDNIPTGTDMIALNRAGLQTLTFSEAIANPVFAFVSLNSNGYAFDQDFEILSVAGQNIDGNGVDANGYWGGSATAGKTVVDLGGGVFEYRLVTPDSSEPHGVIRFLGSFDTLSWTSLSAENWNGFTLGVQGTAAEVFPEEEVPLPAGALLLPAGLLALAGARRRKG